MAEGIAMNAQQINERMAELEQQRCNDVVAVLDVLASLNLQKDHSAMRGLHRLSLLAKRAAEAEKDARRLDWLETQIKGHGYREGEKWRGVSVACEEQTLREAIDERMGK